MKKYYVTFYLRTDKGDKLLGALQFNHTPTAEFPVDRKAFMLADSRLIMADKLKIEIIR